MRHFLTIALILAATSLSAQVPTSGLRVHLKADAGTSTTTENAGVTSWTDQSGNGFTATAPAGQPVYQSNVINGMPAVFFNGAQYLHIGNTGALGLQNSDYEMFFVASSSSANIQFLGSGALGEHETHLNGMGGLRYIPNPTYSINHGANGAYTDGAPRIFGVRATTTTGATRVNGADVSLAQNMRSTSDAMFRLGIRASGDYALVGHIAEVIIYNRVLSKVERNQVETYLAQKYGVTGTTANAPTVSLDAPSSSQQLGNTFSGTVNPNGAATTYRFLYGTSAANLNMSTEPKSVGSGSSAVAVSASIPGLAPGQTYHVALVAENVSQLTKTSTQAFTVTTRPTGTTTLALPADGLKIHLKSDVGLSTTVEQQGIAEWSDVSGNGRNATMVVEAARPIFRGSALNGGPAVQFTDGRWMLLTNPSTIGLLNSDYEMFFVAQSGNPGIQFLVAGTLPNYELHLNGASGQRFIPRHDVFVDVGTNGQYTNNVPRIFSGRASGTSTVSRVNGVESQAALSGLTTADGQLRLGIRADASYPFYGEMAEVLMYNRILSTQERAQVEHYLAQKYGIDSDNLILPTVSIETPTTTQGLTASFSGMVNPNGVATSVRFAYGTDPNNLTMMTDPVSIGSGSIDVPVSATVTGLSRFQTYHVKLIATTDFQMVETGSTTFTTDYVEVASTGVSIAAQDDETVIYVNADLTVPTETGSEYRIRFGSFETDFAPADDLSGTFTIERFLPNTDLEFATSYDVTVIARSPSGKLSYSDTLSIRYVGIPTATLTSLTPLQTGEVIVSGSVNPNGSSTSYLFRYGTDPDDLAQSTSAVSIGNGIAAVSITDTLALSTGETYWVRLVGTDGDNLAGSSDTLSVSTDYAVATIDSVTSTWTPDLIFHGRVNPQGLETSVRFRFGSSRTTLNVATEWEPVGSGTNPVAVSTAGNPLPFGNQYYVVMEADNGVNIGRSDTLAFDTKFVEINSVSLTLSNDATPQIQVQISLNTFDAAGAEYRILYGTNAENLSPLSGFTAVEDDVFIHTLTGITPVPGTSYYVQVEARGASGKTTSGFVRGIRYSTAPTAVLSEITTSQDLSVTFSGSVNPNGGVVSYSLSYGTDPNNLDQSTTLEWLSTSDSSPVSVSGSISGLTAGTIYYAELRAFNDNHSTQTSDRLTIDMRYATVEYFNSDVESPTNVRFYMGVNPHGSAKSGTVRYGANADNLNRSVTDPVSYTGTSTVSRTSLVNLFSPDSSYYAQWVIEDLNGGPTSYSDVVSFNTIFPVVTIDSVLTVGNLALGVRATVDTKNQSTTLKQSLRQAGGSFSTASTETTVAASSSPVSVLLPLTGVSTDEAYDLRLLANNTFSNEAFSDTVAFDSYFVQFDAPSVAFAGADVAVRAELQAEPDLAYAYRILKGTRADSLTATGDFVTMNTSDRYTDIDVVLDADTFTPDSTYYFAIEGRGASGWISRSDTLSLVFQSPFFARTPSVQVLPSLATTASTTVFPNGRTLDVQYLLGTSPDSLTAIGTPTRISGVDSVLATRSLPNLIRFTDYHLALMISEVGSGDTTRTDTVAFNTDFTGVTIYSYETFVDVEADGQPIYGRIIGYVEHGSLETSAWVTYRKESETSLQSTTPVQVEIIENQVGVVQIDFGPLDPNSAYRARFRTTNGMHTTMSDSLWFETSFPKISLASLQAVTNGDVFLSADIDRNGETGTFGFRYGTHPDSMNTVHSVRTFNSDNDPQFTSFFNLFQLDVSKTYYGQFDIIRGYDQRTNRSATFSWDYVFPAVTSSTLSTSNDLTASVDATIDTKGSDVNFWVEVYNAVDGWSYTDTLSVTGSATPVDVTMPLGSFDRFSSNVMVLALQAQGGPVIYADTTTFNFNYALIADAAIARSVVDDETFLEISANLSLENGTLASYRVFFGEQGGSLSPLSDAVTIQPASSSHSVNVSVGPDDLVVGTTYAAMIEATGQDGKTTLSDTVSVTYGTRPQITAFNIVTAADLSASYTASMVSNNTAGSYRLVYGTSPENLYAATDAVSFDDDISVDAMIGTFSRASTWYAVLEIVTDNYSSVRSDTISFDLSYPTIQFRQSTPSIMSDNKIFVSLIVENFNRASSLFVEYGYSNHVDSLVYENVDFNLEAATGTINSFVTIGPVVRNDSVYYRVGHTTGEKTTWSDIRSVYSIGHKFTVDTPILTSTGGGKFRAVVKVVLDPNGMSTSVREFIATAADFTGQVSNGDVALANMDIQELEYVFEDLVIGQTYFVKVEAYDNQTYKIFNSSDVLQIAFDSSPMIENLAIVANPDLTIGLSGTLYPFGSDLTYHVAYGQDRNNLTLRTDSVTVSADSSTVVIDQRIANLERFSTWHAVIVIESDGYAPIRTDTLSAVLAFPTFVFGTPSTAANGNVSVPFTVDNGGFDTQVWLAGFNSDTTAVDGSNEPVEVTLVIPNPGVGVQLDIVALADTDGLISRSDTLSYTTKGPEFTFVRAFARQDYKAILQAAVNPNGIATQIRFEWGPFGSFQNVSEAIDLGDGNSVVDTTFISSQSLYFNADHVARLVVFGEGFEFISNTIHFNARIPGIGINDIQVISSDSVVVSVQISSQGINTFARLAYGPVGSGYPDTTAALARPSDDTMQYFDMILTGLESSTEYQVKLLVQDQADLNKIAATNPYTFITPVGTDVDFDQVAGTAIAFDASAARVEFPNTAAITTFTSYTIQMWFKTDDATRDVQFLTSKGSEHMEIHLAGGNQSLRFIPRPGRYFDTPSNSIQSGVWTHLSATLDVENNLAKVYLNGVDMPLIASGDNYGLPFVSFHSDATNLHIGRRTDEHFPFGGEIDEIRLWNTARTPLQVWDDMHNTTPSEYDASLVFYAQLNEGTGGTTVDAAGGIAGHLLDFEDQSWVTSTAPINNGARYSTQLNGIAGWRFLSAPVQTTVGQLLTGIWTQGFTGATTSNGAPNVYTWNAANAQNSASNWTPVTNGSQALAPGDGLFVYVYDGAPGSASVWPKTLSVTGQSLREVPSLTSRLNPNVDGWALVGNPYSIDISWGDLSRGGLYNAVYSWDPNNEEWATWNGTTGGLANGRIGAFNAFLVATMSESPSLSVPFNARRAGSSQFLGKVAETQAATFSLKVESPDGRSNRAWFSFDANGKLGLDEHDAFKLAPYSQQYVQLASVIQDSIRLDINHLPMLTEEVTIPLKLTSTANGTYRLSLNGNALPRGWDYAVIDTETGASSKLDQPLEFAWTGAGKELSRFVLKLSPNTITSTERGPDAPLAFALGQNYPNPFNPTTVIGFTVGTQDLASLHTRLTVYDMLGREVAVLVDGVMSAGTHSVTFDGSGLSSGVYLYRLESGGKVLSRKFTLIK